MAKTSLTKSISTLLHIVAICYLLYPMPILCQIQIGSSPIIESYGKADFSGGAQSWDSDVLPSGQVIVANDQGILIYDGSRWQKYSLPNGSIVRSVMVHKDKVFVGGQDEIGFLSPDTSGMLSYTSIYDEIPDRYLPLQDVWEIEASDNTVHFRSVNRIYSYDVDLSTFSVIDPMHPVISMHNIEGEIYFADLYRGVVSLSDTSRIYADSDLLTFLPLMEVSVMGSDVLYMMEKDGILLIEDKQLLSVDQVSDNFFRQHNIFCAARIDTERVAVGTSFGGVAIINNRGTIVQVISQKDGLSSNNIHTLLVDNQGDLWAGASTGIDQIRLSSPASVLQPDGTDNGSYYAITHHEGLMYYGTNNGLYASPTGTASNINSGATKVPLSNGQVWGLNHIGEDLMMGHNTGAYQIVDGVPVLISNAPGAWIFRQANTESEMYVGTYNGVDLYRKINQTWVWQKKLEGFMESSRFVVSVKRNEVWVSHPYRGIFKIVHDDEYTVTEVVHYDHTKGLQSDLGNHIFAIDGVIYVTTSSGVHRYESVDDQFQQDDELNASIPNSDKVRRLYEDRAGSVWYLTDVELGRVSSPRGPQDRLAFPDLASQFVNGFEKITFVDTTFALIAGYEKVIKLDTRNRSRTINEGNTIITSVHLMGQRDSIIFGGFSISDGAIVSSQSSDQIPSLSPSQNELLVTYSGVTHRSGDMYSLCLLPEGDIPVDEDWSVWTSSNTKEYTNLSPDTYTLHLRMKPAAGRIGQPSTYTFKINPPWYLSAEALMFYYLLGLGTLIALVFVPRTQYKKEKEALTEAIEVSDAKVEEIQNQKLRAEIEHKNSELASSTMHLVQKNETINKIRKEVQNVSKKLKDPQARKEVRRILSVLSDDERLEDEWDNFSFRFDQVHTDFLKRISADFPKLTPKDKKLCAYLRMNLTTKEIAPLLNISVRGVEISRYRLRKKLELENSVNLTDYMMGY